MSDFFKWLQQLSDKDPLVLALLSLITFGVVLLAGFGFAMTYLKHKDSQQKNEDNRENSLLETVNELARNITRLSNGLDENHAAIMQVSKSQTDLVALENTRLEYRIKESAAFQSAQIELAKNIYGITAKFQEIKEILQQAKTNGSTDEHTSNRG